MDGSHLSAWEGGGGAVLAVLDVCSWLKSRKTDIATICGFSYGFGRCRGMRSVSCPEMTRARRYKGCLWCK